MALFLTFAEKYQDLDAVGQRGRDRFQVLPDRFRAAGQIDDERRLPQRCRASGQHAPRRDPHGILMQTVSVVIMMKKDIQQMVRPLFMKIIISTAIDTISLTVFPRRVGSKDHREKHIMTRTDLVQKVGA